MDRRFIRHLQMSLVTLDLFTMNLVFIGAFLLISNTLFIEKNQYNYWLFFLNAAWLLVSWIGNIYKERYIKSFELFFKRSLKSFIWFLFIVTFSLFYFQPFI